MTSGTVRRLIGLGGDDVVIIGKENIDVHDPAQMLALIKAGVTIIGPDDRPVWTLTELNAINVQGDAKLAAKVAEILSRVEGDQRGRQSLIKR